MAGNPLHQALISKRLPDLEMRKDELTPYKQSETDSLEACAMNQAGYDFLRRGIE
jgi:hypothetical protein